MLAFGHSVKCHIATAQLNLAAKCIKQVQTGEKQEYSAEELEEMDSLCETMKSIVVDEARYPGSVSLYGISI